MSGPDPWFVYTGFRWENGWPVAPPPTTTVPVQNQLTVPPQTPPPQLPLLVPSQMLEEPSPFPPTDTRITSYSTNNTQVMDLTPQVDRDDDQAS
jgi:hypothetical protein